MIHTITKTNPVACKYPAKKLPRALESLFIRHRFVAAGLVFIGVPLFALLAVGLFTAAVALPLGLLCGWL